MLRHLTVWCAAAGLGLACGWSWRARATDCHNPFDGDSYAYAYDYAAVETDDGLTRLEPSDPQIELPRSLDARIANAEDSVSPPFHLRFSDDNGFIDLFLE